MIKKESLMSINFPNSSCWIFTSYLNKMISKITDTANICVPQPSAEESKYLHFGYRKTSPWRLFHPVSSWLSENSSSCASLYKIEEKEVSFSLILRSNHIILKRTKWIYLLTYKYLSSGLASKLLPDMTSR